MSFRVVVVAEAERQIRQADAWWVENRRAAQNLFLDELSRAFGLLAQSPEIGRRFRRARQPGVRRLVMRETRYWVYYVPDPQRGIVYILAIWSTLRLRDPLIFVIDDHSQVTAKS